MAGCDGRMKSRAYYTEFAEKLPNDTIILTAGQCNDSYSLAVIVLFALLYLGVKNIHLGPTIPDFLSPNVAKVLVETFGISGIETVDDDIQLFLG